MQSRTKLKNKIAESIERDEGVQEVEKLMKKLIFLGASTSEHRGVSDAKMSVDELAKVSNYIFNKTRGQPAPRIWWDVVNAMLPY
jgi:hypothetical protein